MASWNRPLISKAIQVVLTYFSCNFCCLFLMQLFIPVNHSNKPWFLKDMYHISKHLKHLISVCLLTCSYLCLGWGSGFLSASKVGTLEAVCNFPSFVFYFFPFVVPGLMNSTVPLALLMTLKYNLVYGVTCMCLSAGSWISWWTSETQYCRSEGVTVQIRRQRLLCELLKNNLVLFLFFFVFWH